MWGGAGGASERAVAGYDEGSLTMACEAALNALDGRDPKKIDLEGSARFYAQLTDCDPAAVGFEMPVELCFRRIHEGEGLVNYFWKFRPLLGV